HHRGAGPLDIRSHVGGIQVDGRLELLEGLLPFLPPGELDPSGVVLVSERALGPGLAGEGGQEQGHKQRLHARASFHSSSILKKPNPPPVCRKSTLPPKRPGSSFTVRYSP